MRFFALGVLFLSICLVDAIAAVAQNLPGDNPDARKVDLPIVRR